MKKTILSITIAAIFASCGSNNNDTNKGEEKAGAVQIATTEDTSGLAQFKEWKQKQEVLSSEQTFTSPGINETQSVAEEKPAPVIIYRDVPAKQPRVAKASRPASRRVYKAPTPEPENPAVTKSPAPVSSGSKREPYGRGSAGTDASQGGETTGSGEGNGDVAVATPAPAEVPAKKNEGWSKAAKGTAIGGTSGAVIGAVISKNKTKGAVIGGIVGAAGGYIFGRSQDKKDGRY